VAARQVWIDDVDAAGRDPGIGGRGDNLDGELVSHDARIAQEGMGALVDMIVSAANADAARLYKCRARREFGVRSFGEFELPRLSANQYVQ
jgi:hypothetical protein